MERRGHVRAALASVASMAGTGFASGRALVLFFAQTGRAAWIGAAFAAAVFGLLMALLCRAAGRMGAEDFATLCSRLLGRGAALAAKALYGLLLALSAAVMLRGAGELGALTLPLRYGFWWGAGAALLAAITVNATRLRALPWLGLALLVSGALFYGGLALDPRPVRVFLKGEVELGLAGNVPAALALGLVYAAMNACVAAGPVLRLRGGSAWRTGALCAAEVGALLACANAAIFRGGALLLGQKLPTVLLSARWGLAGFWLNCAFTCACVTSTLAAVLAGLTDLLHRRRRDGPM